MRICFSCESERGMGIFPVWASWISCNSSCSVKSGFIILRLFSRCLASGLRICLRRASFWFWISFSIWACFCSSVARCWYWVSFFRRMASSSSSDIGFYSPWYFLSSGLVLMTSFSASWLISWSVFLPFGVMILPFGRVVWMRPAVSSCWRIFLMLPPAAFEAWFGLTVKPFLPP